MMTVIVPSQNQTQSSRSILPLICSVQNYDWGQIGKDSLVAMLHESNQSKEPEPQKPYAEFWIGTHVNGHSRVKGHEGYLLESTIGEPLPFLLKVLSVKKALSIQVHPDALTAKQLHAKDPGHYPDPYPKPEMAIALTRFLALCGFLPVKDIVFYLDTLQSWRHVIGNELAIRTSELCSKTYSEVNDVSVKSVLKDIVNKLFSVDASCIENTLKEINAEFLKALQRSASHDRLKVLYPVFIKLMQEFPNDVGIFFIFLLNMVELKPGEGIYLGANEPHAYLNGDCVEVMTASDNVVRAGLTPKFKDVSTLLSMLTFDCGPIERFKVLPFEEQISASLLLLQYKPPTPEFAITKLSFTDEKGEKTRLSGESSHSLMICIQGKGKLMEPSFDEGFECKLGSVFYIAPDTECLFEVSESPLTFYKAYRPY